MFVAFFWLALFWLVWFAGSVYGAMRFRAYFWREFELLQTKARARQLNRQAVGAIFGGLPSMFAAWMTFEGKHGLMTARELRDDAQRPEVPERASWDKV